MALTTCPECKKEVSSQAVSCPHCGFPLSGAIPAAFTPPPAPPSPQQVTSVSPASKTGVGKGCAGCLSVVVLIFVIGWIADMAGCNKHEPTPQEQVLKAMGPDNPIAKRINSLNRNNAYQVGITDGAKDALDASIKMNWDRYDYHSQLRDLRDLKATAFELLKSQNQFDSVVFDQYRRGWDYGASTLSIH